MPFSPTLRSDAPGVPAPFQKEDSQFVARNKRVVLGHKTGMGKTLISLLGWSHWDTRRALICGSKSSMSVWLSQPQEWCEIDAPVHIVDTPAKGDEWNRAINPKNPGIWLVTYDMLWRCMEHSMKSWRGKYPEFDLFINDEAHRIRNRQTQTYGHLRRIRSEYYIAASATWASRGAQDLWAILHLVNPKLFGSYWNYVNTFCWVEKTNFGTDIFGVRNKEQLRKLLSNIYRSRTWKEIGRELPPVRRRPMEYNLTPEQRKIHDALDKDLMADTENGMIIVPNRLTAVTRMRQLCVCPKMLDPSLGYGAGLEHIGDAIEDDPHTVIFTDFKKAIPWIEQYLRSLNYTHIFSLHGGMKPKEVVQVEKEWKSTGGICICTIPFAESFALDTSHTAWILGWNWDPNKNIQAEGRLRRFNSLLTDPVLVNYMMAKNSAEDRVKEVINGKVANVRQVFPDYIDTGGTSKDQNIPLDSAFETDL